MGVKENLQKIDIDEVKALIQQYEYALVYEISQMVFDKIESISQINWNEIQEAYFFNKNSQIHVYQNGNEMQATIYNETEDVKFVDRCYELAGKFHGIGDSIIEREYLEYDDDGQTYVAYARLVTVK